MKQTENQRKVGKKHITYFHNASYFPVHLDMH